MTYLISELLLAQHTKKNNSRNQVSSSSSSLGSPHPYYFILLFIFPWRKNVQVQGWTSIPVPSRGHSGITRRQEQGKGHPFYQASPGGWLELHRDLFIPPGAPGIWTLLPGGDFQSQIGSKTLGRSGSGAEEGAGSSPQLRAPKPSQGKG